MTISLPKKARILVTRTDAMGDVILTTPVYRALKQEFPESHLAVLSREYTEPILRGNKHIDEIITIESETSEEQLRVTGIIEKLNYDVAIALFPSRFAATVIRDAKIPIRIGSARRFHSWKFTHRLNQSRKKNEKSEAQYNLDLLKPLGISSTAVKPEVEICKAEHDSAKALLKSHEAPDSFIVLHPGSGGSAIDWQLEKFVNLADKLSSLGVTSLFTGSDVERGPIHHALKSAPANCSKKILSLAGKTNVRELAAILALADVVVANSTGPLHLAAAVGTRTVGLFPKSASMSPVRWAPPVENTRILQPTDECVTLDISVETVADAVTSAGETLER